MKASVAVWYILLVVCLIPQHPTTRPLDTPSQMATPNKGTFIRWDDWISGPSNGILLCGSVVYNRESQTCYRGIVKNSEQNRTEHVFMFAKVYERYKSTTIYNNRHTLRHMHSPTSSIYQYKFSWGNMHDSCIQTSEEFDTCRYSQDKNVFILARYFQNVFSANTCNNSCNSINQCDRLSHISCEEWDTFNSGQDYISCIQLRNGLLLDFQDFFTSNTPNNNSCINTHGCCSQIVFKDVNGFNCDQDQCILTSLNALTNPFNNNSTEWSWSTKRRNNSRHIVVLEGIRYGINTIYIDLQQTRTMFSESQTQQTFIFSSIHCHIRNITRNKNAFTVKSTPKLLLQWSWVLRNTITKLLELTSLMIKSYHFVMNMVLIYNVNMAKQFIFAFVRKGIKIALCCIMYYFQSFSFVLSRKGTHLKLLVSRSRQLYHEEKIRLNSIPSDSESKSNILKEAESKVIIDSTVAAFQHREHEIEKQMFDHSYMLPGRHVIDCNTFPASIDRYCSDVIKNESNSHDLMKYEWARYKSYATFPKSAVMSPTRLANAGFYYTGRDEEVRCFSCGILNGKWNVEETVMETHSRLAPSCDFIKGIDTQNVPIHAEEQVTTSGSGYQAASNTPNAHEVGATGGAESSVHDVRSTLQEDAHSGAFTENGHCLSQTTEETEDVRSAMNQLTLTSHSQCTNSSLENARFNLPKHPQYTNLAMRLASFTGWRAHVSQQPRELADAGFFYIGYGDCVRCFSCGGGLKEWAYGDTPWAEHARYYPRCAYLKQCKGEQFIRMYQDQRTNTAGQTPGAVGSAGHDKAAVDVTGPVIEQVTEMGYTQNVIQTAIRTFRNRHGSATITTEQIVDIILNEDPTPAPAQTVPPRQEYPNDTTEVPRSSPDRNSDTPKEDSASQLPRQTNTLSNGKTGHSSTNTSKTEPHEANTSSPTPDKKSPKKKSRNGGGRNNSSMTRTEETQSLLEENRQLKSQLLCKICKKNDACMVMIPCGHLASCPSCQEKFRKCPVCDAAITKKIRAYPV